VDCLELSVLTWELRKQKLEEQEGEFMEYLDRGTDVPTGSDKQLTPTAEGPFTVPKPKTDA